MNNIYLPLELNNNNCVIIPNSDTIRVYDNIPNRPGTYTYTDYYINSNYIYNKNSTTYSNYNNNYPTCLNNDIFTNDYYYRNDFDSILIIFFILFIFIIILPYKIISRLFGRWFKI